MALHILATTVYLLRHCYQQSASRTHPVGELCKWNLYKDLSMNIKELILTRGWWLNCKCISSHRWLLYITNLHSSVRTMLPTHYEKQLITLIRALKMQLKDLLGVRDRASTETLCRALQQYGGGLFKEHRFLVSEVFGSYHRRWVKLVPVRVGLDPLQYFGYGCRWCCPFGLIDLWPPTFSGAVQQLKWRSAPLNLSPGPQLELAGMTTLCQRGAERGPIMQNSLFPCFSLCICISGVPLHPIIFNNQFNVR